MKHETVVILDFGGQINQLIARRARELSVYSEVLRADTPVEEIKKRNPIGIILTGGKKPVQAGDKFREDILELGIPILATGYGSRLLMSHYGGEFAEYKKGEWPRSVNVSDEKIFSGLKSSLEVWGNDYQKAEKKPEGLKVIAETNGEIWAMADNAGKLNILLFNPELSDTEGGKDIIKNFLFDVCGAKGDWSMEQYAEYSIEAIKNKVGNGKVLLALSGGVDSSVVASLLEKSVGEQLYCIFVDHGLMRLNEGDEVESAFKDSGMHFIRVNAQDRFLARLKGVTDPETKRKIIGEEFIRVFEEEAKKIGTVDFLAQGTIYPDIIESDLGDGSVIKSHHNVGGLPDHVDFKDIIEPVKILFKDEVRKLGEQLGLADNLVHRQPFPGPGLGVRVIGDITKDKLDILRQADYIFREEMAKAGLDKVANQYFAIITDMRSVGVSGEKRTYDYTIALRAVATTDFMTAKWVDIPNSVLRAASQRITSAGIGVNRVVYDITDKPPATIEWE